MSFDLNTDFGAGGTGPKYDDPVTYFRPAISIGYNFGALYDVK